MNLDCEKMTVGFAAIYWQSEQAQLAQLAQLTCTDSVQSFSGVNSVEEVLASV